MTDHVACSGEEPLEAETALPSGFTPQMLRAARARSRERHCISTWAAGTQGPEPSPEPPGCTSAGNGRGEGSRGLGAPCTWRGHVTASALRVACPPLGAGWAVGALGPGTDQGAGALCPAREAGCCHGAIRPSQESVEAASLLKVGSYIRAVLTPDRIKQMRHLHPSCHLPFTGSRELEPCSPPTPSLGVGVGWLLRLLQPPCLAQSRAVLRGPLCLLASGRVSPSWVPRC